MKMFKAFLSLVVLTGCVLSDTSMNHVAFSEEMDSFIEFLTNNRTYLAIRAFNEQASMDGREYRKLDKENRDIMSGEFFKKPYEKFTFEKSIGTQDFLISRVYFIQTDGLFWIQGWGGDKIKVYGPITFDELRASAEKERASWMEKKETYSKEMQEAIASFEKNLRSQNKLLGRNLENKTKVGDEILKNEHYEKFSLYPPLTVVDGNWYTVYRRQTDGAFFVWRFCGFSGGESQGFGPVTFQELTEWDDRDAYSGWERRILLE